jgi:hypothetical protein
MHSDHPTLFDKLDRLTLVQAKAAQIINCHPPQTFGIHGDWGSGKTSFLRQLRYHLDGSTDGCEKKLNRQLPKGQYKDKTITIWFDAWQYQHEAAPVIALLHEIRRQLSTWSQLKNSAMKLGTVAGRSVLNSINEITKLLKLEAIPIDAKGIQKVGEQWEKQNLEVRLGVDTIQDFLRDAIKELIGENTRLVIFIDDLDRCSPTAAYRLLEGLKIYLNLNNCVFLLGMNQEIIIDAIATEQTRYDSKGSEAALRLRAEAYLEKLCASIERLTPPFDGVKLLLQWIDDSNLRTAMTSALTDDQGQFIRCLPPNPRRIKSLANVLNQWFEMIELTGSQVARDTSTQSLLIVAYVYQFHSELFQRWQFTPSFFVPFNEWATLPLPANITTLPDYFACLALPEKVTSNNINESDELDENITAQPTPAAAASNYPDPYAVNMFWIQPLMIYSQLQERDTSAIISAVTSTQNPSP